MAFFPRFVVREHAPALRGENNLFRLLDEYASLIGSRSTTCTPSFTQPIRTFKPRFDVKESTDSYELHGELPGIAQKDVNIEFTDATTLSIRGRTESVKEEGRHPTAAVEAKPEQEQQEQEQTDAAEWESVPDSNNYHKASVEDENSTATAAATPAETPAASNAPVPQEKSQDQPADRSNYWLSERSVGIFARSFEFPQRIDQDAVKASLKDGILSIVVPKAPAPANRTIVIE